MADRNAGTVKAARTQPAEPVDDLAPTSVYERYEGLPGFEDADGDGLQAASRLAWTERVNSDEDGQTMLAPFEDRIQDAAERTGPAGHDGDEPPLPAGFAPWWSDPVKVASATARGPLPISVDGLLEQSLQFSPYVSVVSMEPEIRQLNIVVESAEFDWRTFLDSTYNGINDPIGNTLTTGNLTDTRFYGSNWGLDAGVRRKNSLGGEMEVAQQFGTQGNNSRFLLPNSQGTARLQLQYTQPLMNGAGRFVNGSRIVLADLDANISQDEALALLQDHLLKVAEGYWELYRARAEYFQRAKLLADTQSTLEVLQARRGIDAVDWQILRVKAAVNTRRSEIIRAQTAIRNAQSQLTLLVNSPELVYLGGKELTPVDLPLDAPLEISMEDSLHTALLHRPDISQTIRSVRGSAVRLGVMQRQVLPKLDLIASTYVAGLAPESDIVSAFGKQFAEGRPGYALGFVFEMPWGNRAACARQQQRHLEMNRELARFRLTTQQALTSTEVAVREVKTAYREVLSRYQSMTATENEVRHLFERWSKIPGVDDSAAFLLSNLLDSQVRLTEEESALVRAQVNYAMAIVRMKREMGTLLRLIPQVSADMPAVQFGESSLPESEQPHPADPNR
jgi:outer membrane protein TolC